MDKNRRDEMWKDLINDRTETLAKKVKELHESNRELYATLEQHINNTTALWEMVFSQNARMAQLEKAKYKVKPFWKRWLI